MPYSDPDTQRSYQQAHYQRTKVAALERRRARKDRIRQVYREAKNQPCADCGGRFPYYVMDFDHRGETPKVNHLSVLMNGGHGPSMARLLAEIEKCDVVCANCHRVRSWRRQSTARHPS